jgi:hypothetical protein
MQSYINFAGAIHAGSAAPDAAKAYLEALAHSSAREAWTAGGFEPLSGGR